MFKKYFFLITLFCGCRFAWAQDTDTSYISQHLELDSVVISASRVDFNVPGFIKMVEDDTTFYKAFKNLRILAYTGENNIRILGKNDKIKASLLSTTRQHRQGDCRTMSVRSEKTTGNFYDRKKDYNYYTAELYANLFFTRGKVCGENNIVKGEQQSQPTGDHSMDKHKEELKQLIFNPGQPIPGVPLISNKVAIFDDKVAPMYDFSVTAADYDSIPCYVFTAIAKPAYRKNVVINKLVTYFNKQDLEIVYRDYSLSYNAWVFDFDVHIKVNMTHFHNYMVPSIIKYDGDWKVPFHKREHAIFTAKFHDFALKGE
ncbi:MAG TPA: hypothetical protein VFX43_14035 [Chitinophagaceae bacterium]|jgi:hypothetical protein|nr:hypothetical protein [Chitinophagaceae bacterium]